MMESPLRDDIDNFHLDRDKILLDDAGYSDSDSLDGISEDDMEVLPLDQDDHQQYYISESDENGEDDLVQTKAWGSSKKAFYSQEEVGISSSDEADELEEQEAIALQDKMAATLSEVDFQSIMSLGQSKDDQEKDDEIVQDLSKLSDEDKLAFIERTSPELHPLIESFKNSYSLVLQSLIPDLTALTDDKRRQVMELKIHINLCYCVNVMFYLTLKSSKQSTQSHPVIGRILSLKQLISQLDNIDLSNITTDKGPPLPVAPDNRMVDIPMVAEDPLAYYDRIREVKGRKKVSTVAEPMPEGEFEEIGEKRPISYKISRNKGLTPKRSKEQRNPRVKHRKKFKKALQKRKGQVLPVQSELTRYGGESSGIRSTVTRSVKIK